MKEQRDNVEIEFGQWRRPEPSAPDGSTRKKPYLTPLPQVAAIDGDEHNSRGDASTHHVPESESEQEGPPGAPTKKKIDVGFVTPVLTRDKILGRAPDTDTQKSTINDHETEKPSGTFETSAGVQPGGKNKDYSTRSAALVAGTLIGLLVLMVYLNYRSPESERHPRLRKVKHVGTRKEASACAMLQAESGAQEGQTEEKVDEVCCPELCDIDSDEDATDSEEEEAQAPEPGTQRGTQKPAEKGKKTVSVKKKKKKLKIAKAEAVDATPTPETTGSGTKPPNEVETPSGDVPQPHARVRAAGGTAEEGRSAPKIAPTDVAGDAKASAGEQPPAASTPRRRRRRAEEAEEGPQHRVVAAAQSEAPPVTAEERDPKRRRLKEPGKDLSENAKGLEPIEKGQPDAQPEQQLTPGSEGPVVAAEHSEAQSEEEREPKRIRLEEPGKDPSKNAEEPRRNAREEEKPVPKEQQGPEEPVVPSSVESEGPPGTVGPAKREEPIPREQHPVEQPQNQDDKSSLVTPGGEKPPPPGDEASFKSDEPSPDRSPVQPPPPPTEVEQPSVTDAESPVKIETPLPLPRSPEQTEGDDQDHELAELVKKEQDLKAERERLEQEVSRLRHLEADAEYTSDKPWNDEIHAKEDWDEKRKEVTQLLKAYEANSRWSRHVIAQHEEKLAELKRQRGGKPLPDPKDMPAVIKRIKQTTQHMVQTTLPSLEREVARRKKIRAERSDNWTLVEHAQIEEQRIELATQQESNADLQFRLAELRQKLRKLQDKLLSLHAEHHLKAAHYIFTFFYTSRLLTRLLLLDDLAPTPTLS
ncbi:unnamed protein product [Amoebophrya sp. A25]|nr:unnamed protein product [Amoebophrya sp. A25]|eukprot:GSA25T00023168001.1